MDRVAGGRLNLDAVIKYWYHFAIMFEALFILTTIDTGTRIARFLLQEVLGKIYKPFERTDWLPGAVLSTAVVTAAWGGLIATGSIDTIWPMFGIANQMLAVIALAVVTTVMFNAGRGRYAPLTILPMLFVIATTTTAGVRMASGTVLERPGRRPVERQLSASDQMGAESAGDRVHDRRRAADRCGGGDEVEGRGAGTQGRGVEGDGTTGERPARSE